MPPSPECHWTPTPGSHSTLHLNLDNFVERPDPTWEYYWLALRDFGRVPQQTALELLIVLFTTSRRGGQVPSLVSCTSAWPHGARDLMPSVVVIPRVSVHSSSAIRGRSKAPRPRASPLFLGKPYHVTLLSSLLSHLALRHRLFPIPGHCISCSTSWSRRQLEAGCPRNQNSTSWATSTTSRVTSLPEPPRKHRWGAKSDS